MINRLLKKIKHSLFEKEKPYDPYKVFVWTGLILFMVFFLLIFFISSADSYVKELFLAKITIFSIIIAIIAVFSTFLGSLYAVIYSETQRYFSTSQLLFNHFVAFKQCTSEDPYKRIIDKEESKSLHIITHQINSEDFFYQTFRFQQFCLNHFRVLTGITSSIEKNPFFKHENETLYDLINSNYEFELLLPFFEDCKIISYNVAKREDISEALREKYKKHSGHLEALVKYLEKVGSYSNYP